jgi:hypothetical protein
MDLTSLDDVELDQLRLDVLSEQERRARLAAAPALVADIAARYIGDGGNPADLTATIPAGEGTA